MCVLFFMSYVIIPVRFFYPFKCYVCLTSNRHHSGALWRGSMTSSSQHHWCHSALIRAEHLWTLSSGYQFVPASNDTQMSTKDVAKCPLEEKIAPAKRHWSTPLLNLLSTLSASQFFSKYKCPKPMLTLDYRLDNFFTSVSSYAFLVISNVFWPSGI